MTSFPKCLHVDCSLQIILVFNGVPTSWGPTYDEIFDEPLSLSLSLSLSFYLPATHSKHISFHQKSLLLFNLFTLFISLFFSPHSSTLLLSPLFMGGGGVGALVRSLDPNLKCFVKRLVLPLDCKCVNSTDFINCYILMEHIFGIETVELKNEVCIHFGKYLGQIGEFPTENQCIFVGEGGGK